MSRSDDLASIESGLLALRGLNNAVISASKVLTAAETGVLLVDATAGNITITLPAANKSMDVRVHRVDNTGNRLVVQAAGAEKIKFHTHLRAMGYPFLVLMGAGDFWHLRSDGNGNWTPLDRFETTVVGRSVFETTMAINPGGWGLANGSLLARTEWPWLWDHAQQSGMLVSESERSGMEGAWSSGDGTSTFRIPDLRSDFLRSLDEGRGLEKDAFYGVVTNGSKVVNTVNFLGTTFGVGASVTATSIPAGAVVTAVDRAAATITLSIAATATGTTVLTAIGRRAGSSQAGTAYSIDTGSSNAVLGGKIAATIDPSIARGQFGLDEGDSSKYPATAGYFGVAATGSAGFINSTESTWGLARPRNIALPTRLKMI